MKLKIILGGQGIGSAAGLFDRLELGELWFFDWRCGENVKQLISLDSSGKAVRLIVPEDRRISETGSANQRVGSLWIRIRRWGCSSRRGREAHQELFAHITHLSAFDHVSHIVPRLEWVFDASQRQSTGWDGWMGLTHLSRS
jgi:hypothetical protein